jgi:glycerol kinase
MSYTIALDQGTTSSRALLFDANGSVVATAQRPFQQHFPEPGWVEHDPEDIWNTQLGCLSEVIAISGVSLADVAAMGITNQRETTLVWDRETGKPVYPAIVWQDRRTAPLCDALNRDGHKNFVQDTTGLVLDAYFSATKLAWILDRVDPLRERAAAGTLAFGTVDAWLLWKLTGGAVHATDVSNASRTMLMDIRTGAWSTPMLELLRIPPEVLPEIKPSQGLFGHARWSGGDREVPIYACLGDQQAALYGQYCEEPGAVKNTYGTGCFMLMQAGNTPPVSNHQLLSTVAWSTDAAKRSYAMEGAVFMAGATIQWLRDGLGIIEESSAVEALAASVGSSDGVVLVPAFVGLGAPHWDPSARGTLMGLTRGTTRAHIAYAALESIAFQTFDVLKAMEADTGLPISSLRVDGGASANNLLMQLQADMLGVPVVRPHMTESTAWGAARMAGQMVGLYDGSVASLNSDVFEPRLRTASLEDSLARWHRAIDRAKTWAI